MSWRRKVQAFLKHIVAICYQIYREAYHLSHEYASMIRLDEASFRHIEHAEVVILIFALARF